MFVVRTYRVWGEEAATNHVDARSLMCAGLGVAALALVLLVLACRAILGNSPRGHRVLGEGAVLLILGLPALGVNTLSAINRNYDTSTAIPRERQITRMFTTHGIRGQYSRHRRAYQSEYDETPTVWSATLPTTSRVDGRTHSLRLREIVCGLRRGRAIPGCGCYDGKFTLGVAQRI